MRSISLIELPYDSGRFDQRMGRGPRAILEAGLPEYLQKKEFNVEVAPIRLAEDFYAEARSLVELQRLAVPQIRNALSAHARPIILSGNCATAALSAMGALGANEIGVVWFDAHGDFNTPETSPSGFLD